MKIPKIISLGGIEITINVNDTLVEKSGFCGICNYQRQVIELDTNAGEGLLQLAYFHELIHWILFVMQEHELRDNEKFVDLFATFLHQAIKSGNNAPPFMEEENVLVESQD